MTGDDQQHPLPLLVDLAGRIGDVSPAWRDVIRVELAALPRVDEQRATRARALGIEAIYEGWLLHRGVPRVVESDAPLDLRLLIGDWCYAAGLCEVADHGSLDDVGRLAALVADVSARGDEPVVELEAAWDQALAAMLGE